MKRSIAKSILLVLIMVILLLLIPSKSYADTGKEFSFGNIMGSVREFLDKGESSASGDTVSDIVDEIQPIINALYWVGVSIVMGAAMFLGLQYFQATGDPKTRAEIQGKLIGFSISAVVLLAAYPIWSFLVIFIAGLLK